MADHYDIIGDIHGYAVELEKLLRQMGYRKVGGVYQHPTRKVLFLGDFIDRGPEQAGVLEIVMPMVKSGAAKAIMGNHEYNAICFHTLHRQTQKGYLRPRNPKHTKQHEAFLQEFMGKGQEQKLKEVLDFFRELPLYLDLPEFRAIHATWDPASLKVLAPYLDEKNCLTEAGIHATSEKGTVAYDALDTLLKGYEYPFPEGHFFKDKDGNERRKARLKWWYNRSEKLGDLTLPSHIVSAPLSDKRVQKQELIGYPETEKILFIGHYWMQGIVEPQAKNLACLDYSIAKFGRLVCYRWSGEQELQMAHYNSVQAAPKKEQEKRYKSRKIQKYRL